jgi:hypothetical protein
MKLNPEATDVLCTDDALQVTLSDGRIISVPLAWSPIRGIDAQQVTVG